MLVMDPATYHEIPQQINVVPTWSMYSYMINAFPHDKVFLHYQCFSHMVIGQCIPTSSIYSHKINVFLHDQCIPHMINGLFQWDNEIHQQRQEHIKLTKKFKSWTTIKCTACSASSVFWHNSCLTRLHGLPPSITRVWQCPWTGIIHSQ